MLLRGICVLQIFFSIGVIFLAYVTLSDFILFAFVAHVLHCIALIDLLLWLVVARWIQNDPS